MICPKCGTENAADVRFCKNCGFALRSRSARSANQLQKEVIEYAGFWRRFFASLIDDIIFSVPLLIWLGLGLIHPLVLTYFIVIFVRRIYYAGMESSSRQGTLGKMAIGLIVTDMEGERISFGKATVRYFSKALSGLLFNAGYIMIAFTEKRQGLHDMIAGCSVVVKEYNPSSYSDYYTRPWYQSISER